ncbi:hypothetical protein [Consotaella aegiceratis]|uniref:hypothetical protein n=1 Tax=Consotaella aegiceratis TaxID=3097961 RepID=UPI002F3ECA58
MDTLMTILQPIIELLLTIAITVVVPVAVAALWKWLGKLGLDVDQKHRDALQTAIQNAALVAVSKMGGPAIATTVSGAALETAVDYVKRASPDAVKHFDLSADAIAEKVRPKAEAIVQTTPTITQTVAGAAGGAALDAGLAALVRAAR